MLVGQQIGPFAIERELGSGAMGTVYRALFATTGQYVALKIISPGQLGNETAIARFERESAILKQLKHPNIVRWIGTGRYRKTPFFAMEYVEGESLDKVLARRGRFTWEEVVTLGQQLCAALTHAHAAGIIHRDLKPSNLMILPDGTLKLTDFGIAKDTDLTGLTGANCTVGTAAYMSPEQCRGERNLTFKVDLYALGVAFYELLTGQKPFQAEAPVEMFMKHVHGEFVRPGRLVLDLPVWLDTLVCQLLEKKPEHRPLDAATVGRALAEVRDKVEAQKSAGVEAATARRIDRPRSAGPADETDRAAARTLNEAVTKKKRKPKAKARPPFYTRGWFLAVAATLLVGGTGGAVYLAVRPPGPQRMVEDIQRLRDRGDREAALVAIGKYLAAYGTDKDADQVRQWERDIRAARRETQLHNRFRIQKLLDEEGYKQAGEALERENRGELARARESWQQLRDRYKDAPDDDGRDWASLAEKKLADLDAVGPHEQRLQRWIEDGRADQFRAESEPERLAFSALRLGAFGDRWAARDRWKQLVEELKTAEKTQGDLSARPWLLLAADRKRKAEAAAPSGESKEKEREARHQLVRRKYDEAVKLLGTRDDRRAQVRGSQILEEIAALYDDDADAELARLAKQAGPLAKSIG